MRLLRGRASNASSTGYSVIDDRLTIRGEIDTDGAVRVDGRIVGALHRAGSLIVAARGEIVGDIEAAEVVVAGTVRGNVEAATRLEIEPGASVYGDIRAGVVVMREGAVVHGKVSIGASPATDEMVGARLELAPATVARARV